MFRRRSTTSDSTDASAYSRRAAVGDSLWAAQDRVRSALGGAFRGVARATGDAAERASFPLQKRVFWPLEDRAATAGGPTRTLAGGIAILVAAAVGVAGLIWAAPDGRQNTAPSAVVAARAPSLGEGAAPAAKRPAPTLHGAAPVFKPARPTEASEVEPVEATISSTPSGSTKASSSDAAGSGAATSSSAATQSAEVESIDGRPAGPAAVAVAHDFSDAFVVYETGGLDGGVRRAFGETATPELSRALLRRPPRLPANVEVPRAKVLNVVAGPSHDGVYAVSVSLLRVGVTSELRLDMEQLKGREWRVTNVLG
jgi:hypothetical protein